MSVGGKIHGSRALDAGMVELLTLAFVAAGGVLLFAGAALSVYGVALLGAVLGGGGGYLLAPTIGGALPVGGVAANAVAVVIGLVAGVVVAYSLLGMVVAAAGFVTGAFVGLYVLNPLFVEGEWFVEVAAAVGAGLVGGFAGMIMTKTVLVGVTSFIGAALASRQLTMADFRTAAEGPTIDPLIWEFTAPAFLALLALGLLTQIGLFKFGYVTRLTALLPGADIVTDSGDDEGKAAGG